MLRSLAIVGALSVALLPPMYMGTVYHANAQEPPKCVTMADAQADIAKAGAEIVGGGMYNGQNTDEILIVKGPETIVLFFFKDGCLVTGFVADHAVPEKDA